MTVIDTSASTKAESAESPSRVKAVLGSAQLQSSLTVAVFAAIFAGYGIWLGSAFLQADARLLNVHQTVPILLIGMAALVTLVAGQFDLSVASNATLAAYLTVGLRAEQGWSFGIVLVVVLLTGVLLGLVNGLLVQVVNVNAFIATLGTGGVVLGASRVYSDGGPISPLADGPQVPQWFKELGAYTSHLPSWASVIGAVLVTVLAVRVLSHLRPSTVSPRTWLGGSIVTVIAIIAVLHLTTGLTVDGWLSKVSSLVAVMLAVACALFVLLERTSFGRSLKAAGANPVAARLAGVDVRGAIIGSFMIGGLVASLAGVLLAANTGTVSPNMAGPFLLPAFAAAFLSTVVFSTGPFNIWGTVLGGIFVVWVSQGLIVGGLPPTWTDAVNGIVLIAAVAVSTAVRRAKTL